MGGGFVAVHGFHLFAQDIVPLFSTSLTLNFTAAPIIQQQKRC
jgi:hypothetical protein